MNPLTQRGALVVMVVVNLALLGAVVAGDRAMCARDVPIYARRPVELAFLGPPAIWAIVADVRRKRRRSER